MAAFLLSVMGAFAEFERALICERQREGIELAKKRGARTEAARGPSASAGDRAAPAGRLGGSEGDTG
jgi:DNA invertase Pin-like site-specific DNA recombinase